MALSPALTRVRYLTDIPKPRWEKDRVVLCDRKIPQSIRKAFRDPILINGGESLKTLSSVEVLARRVLHRYADRSMTIVAVGGGSVGDAVGFLSSILWRGVRLIHVPTTLLAMVDSAHGGKTAVNLSRVKNQLGTFYPAQEVWIVRSILDTLSPKLVKEGMAEVVKAALLGDRKMVERYFRHGIFGPSLMTGIRSAIGIKQKICKQDPWEKLGKRDVLNLGHTLAHGLEATTKLSHGQAVAWGLCAASLVSGSFGFRRADAVMECMKPLLVSPEKWPTRKSLQKVLALDKKQKGQKFRSVVLEGLGKPKVTTRVSVDQWIEGLTEVRRRFYG